MADVSAAALVLSLLAGGGLGAIYFGGLWWTVRRAASFRRPALTMLASALVRLGVALGGFYVVGAGSWQRLVLCLLGFVVARAAVTWHVRQRAPVAGTGILHAP
ncbi:MAG: ATP synthase subunit I [Pseudomonadota bacterium]|nr:ATP synthase subunit I [Pseudomonadota bacterium]